MDAPKKQPTAYINPSTKRAEYRLKTMLQEAGAIELYEAPPNNDLSKESDNQRQSRRARINKNFTRKKEGKEACRRYRKQEIESEIFIYVKDNTGVVDQCSVCPYYDERYVEWRNRLILRWETYGSIDNIPSSGKLEVVHEAFAKLKRVHPSRLCFFLNGNAIDLNETCRSLGLKDDDEIDCFLAIRSQHNTHTHPDYPYVINDETGRVKRVLRPSDLQKDEIRYPYVIAGHHHSLIREESCINVRKTLIGTGHHHCFGYFNGLYYRWGNTDGLRYCDEFREKISNLVEYKGHFRLNLLDPESADLEYLGRLGETGQFEYDKNGFKGRFDYMDRDLPSNQHWFRGKFHKDSYNPSTHRKCHTDLKQWLRPFHGYVDGAIPNEFNEAEYRAMFSTLTINHPFEMTGGNIGRTDLEKCRTVHVDSQGHEKFVYVIRHYSSGHSKEAKSVRPGKPWEDSNLVHHDGYIATPRWKTDCRIASSYGPVPENVVDFIKRHHGDGKVEISEKDLKVLYAKLAEIESRVEVRLDCIEFLQCTMEWGNPLHLCAWKKLCEVEEGRSMTMDEILNTPQAIDWGHRPYLDRNGKQALRPCNLQKKEIRITGTNGFVYAFVNFEETRAGLQYLGRSEQGPEGVLHRLRQRRDSTDSDSSDDSAPILIRHQRKKKKAEVLEKMPNRDLTYKYDENFKGEYCYCDRHDGSNKHWFRASFRNAYANQSMMCTIDELLVAKIQILGRKWKHKSPCCIGDFITLCNSDYATTLSVTKRARNEFELKILHSFLLRHGTTDWTWEEEFDIGITCGPLSSDVVDELETLYGSYRSTNDIGPTYKSTQAEDAALRRIQSVEDGLKASLAEKNAMDLYDAPRDDDLAHEPPNKRKARRERIRIKMEDRESGRERERLSKKRMMKNVETVSFDYDILRRHEGIKVKFDYITFQQSSMEWGDRLHFIAWKSICEHRERKSMYDNEIMNTPQALRWERNRAERSAKKIQRVWRSFKTSKSSIN